jgi:NAD(P) transhydrogenase subunit alpha
LLRRLIALKEEPMHEPSGLIENLFVFVLASFLGLELIRGVSRLLHTPLMSLTNAIASIAIVGSVLITGREHDDPVITVLGVVAIACSTINAVGGFLITERILKMFRKRGE